MSNHRFEKVETPEDFQEIMAVLGDLLVVSLSLWRTARVSFLGETPSEEIEHLREMKDRLAQDPNSIQHVLEKAKIHLERDVARLDEIAQRKNKATGSGD